MKVKYFYLNNSSILQLICCGFLIAGLHCSCGPSEATEKNMRKKAVATFDSLIKEVRLKEIEDRNDSILNLHLESIKTDEEGG